jgi:hypothetical protein
MKLIIDAEHITGKEKEDILDLLDLRWAEDNDDKLGGCYGKLILTSDFILAAHKFYHHLQKKLPDLPDDQVKQWQEVNNAFGKLNIHWKTPLTELPLPSWRSVVTDWLEEINDD